jgi:hypothetical protein
MPASSISIHPPGRAVQPEGQGTPQKARGRDGSEEQGVGETEEDGAGHWREEDGQEAGKLKAGTFGGGSTGSEKTGKGEADAGAKVIEHRICFMRFEACSPFQHPSSSGCSAFQQCQLRRRSLSMSSSRMS